MTFAMLGRCADSGSVGVAISTAIPCVGGLCLRWKADVGVVTTQSFINPYLASNLLDRLPAEEQLPAVFSSVLSGDAQQDIRQVGFMPFAGEPQVFTGDRCTDWNGQIIGEHYAALGNMLTGEDVLASMADSFRSTADSSLAERLLLALEAGQSVGGDFRGRQSAALLVLTDRGYPTVDLRVDENQEPVGELRRIWRVYQAQLARFVDAMPRPGHPSGTSDPEAGKVIMLPPEQRPAHVAAGGDGQRNSTD